MTELAALEDAATTCIRGLASMEDNPALVYKEFRVRDGVQCCNKWGADRHSGLRGIENCKENIAQVRGLQVFKKALPA